MYIATNRIKPWSLCLLLNRKMVQYSVDKWYHLLPTMSYDITEAIDYHHKKTAHNTVLKLVYVWTKDASMEALDFV